MDDVGLLDEAGVEDAGRLDGGRHEERRRVEDPTWPRTTHQEKGSRGPNAVADDKTIDDGKVSDGSKDGVQRRQRATSLRAREDAEEDGGVGGACWMLLNAASLGGCIMVAV